MNKIKRSLLLIIMTFCMLLPTTVFAAVVDNYSKTEDTYIKAGQSTIGDLEPTDLEAAFKAANVRLGQENESSKLAVKIKGSYYTLIRVKGEFVEINMTTWNEAKDGDVTKSMRYFVDALNDVSASPDAIQQLMSNIQDSNTSVATVMLPLIFESTKGDMYQAYKITSPFLEVLSVVLGVGAVILIILVLFSTVMDLAYIGLPVWRENQANKNGGKQPFGVSYEALTTVKEIEKGIGGGDGGYKNAYLLYFRRRALTYIILAICIFYLIAGGLAGIIGGVLSLVSGITG